MGGRRGPRSQRSYWSVRYCRVARLYPHEALWSAPRKDLMPHPSRRAVARGIAWVVPAVTVSAAAPALALSPSDCARMGIRAGSPLPASAFAATYLIVTRERDGGLLAKKVSLNFGFRVTQAAADCIGAQSSIDASSSKSGHSFTLSNGTTYSGTNGIALPANGSVGVVDTSCESGLGGTEACGTTFASDFNVTGSTSTNSYLVTGVRLRIDAAVNGYGTTSFFISASDIPSTGVRGARSIAVLPV